MWNNCIGAFKQAFIDSGIYSPLHSDDGRILQGLLEYYDMLQQRDAASLKPIELNANSKAFFEKLLALADNWDDYGQRYALLVPGAMTENGT